MERQPYMLSGERSIKLCIKWFSVNSLSGLFKSTSILEVGLTSGVRGHVFGRTTCHSEPVFVHNVGQKYPPRGEGVKKLLDSYRSRVGIGPDITQVFSSWQLPFVWKMLEVTWVKTLTGVTLIEVGNRNGIQFEFVPPACYSLISWKIRKMEKRNLREIG